MDCECTWNAAAPSSLSGTCGLYNIKYFQFSYLVLFPRPRDGNWQNYHCNCTHHMQHLVNMMRHDMENNPKAHLDNDQVEGAVCPSKTAVDFRFGLDCPCAKSSETNHIQSSLGVALFVVPLMLLKTWEREIRACYFREVTKNRKTSFVSDQASNPYKIKYVLGHGNARRADGNQLTDHDIQLMKAVAIDPDPSTNKRPKIKAQVCNGQVLVVTTGGSCLRNIISRFSQKKRFIFQPEPKRIRNRRTGEIKEKIPPLEYRTREYWTLVVNLFVRDECHMERLASSDTIKLLDHRFFREPQNGGMHLVPMSGTLWTQGPIDIAYYIEHMAVDKWNTDNVLRQWMNEEAIHRGLAFQKKIKKGATNNDFDDIVTKFRPLLEKLVIRFTPKSKFLDQGEVVKLPPNIYQEIPCTHSPKWTQRLDAQREAEDIAYQNAENRRKADYKAKYGNLNNYTPAVRESNTLHYRSRLAASFPFLMEMAEMEEYTQDGESLRFTLAEWQEKTKAKKWLNNEDPCFKYINQIAESSGKLIAIRKKIEKFRNHKDPTGAFCR